METHWRIILDYRGLMEIPGSLFSDRVLGILPTFRNYSWKIRRWWKLYDLYYGHFMHGFSNGLNIFSNREPKYKGTTDVVTILIFAIQLFRLVKIMAPFSKQLWTDKVLVWYVKNMNNHSLLTLTDMKFLWIIELLKK